MNVPTNASRGDLINALMDVQQLCNEALTLYPGQPVGRNAAIRTLANLVLDSIHGTVTVTEDVKPTLR